MARSRITNNYLYVSIFIIGLTLGTYAQYTWQYFTPALPTIRSHAPGIWIAGLTMAIGLMVWLLSPWRVAQSKWLQAFFVITLVGWLTRWALAESRDDLLDLTVYLYPVAVVMLWMKLPSHHDMRIILFTLAWTATGLLIWTRFSELVGWIPMAPVSPDLVAFEIGEYWLPLSGTLGPEGRWPGPTGGNAYTGALGALLLVLATVLRSKFSLLFGLTGVLVLLLTSSRGSIAAAGAGLAVALLFGNARILTRLSFGQRGVLAALGGTVVILLVVRTNTGLTGRTTFWLDFIDLWRQSPLTGVGTTGYLEGTNWTATAGSAHSLFIDELSRNGAVGFILLMVGFALAVILAFKAARLNESGPLAILSAIAVMSLVNTPINWLSPSVLWLFYVLPVMWAGIMVQDTRNAVPDHQTTSN